MFLINQMDGQIPLIAVLAFAALFIPTTNEKMEDKTYISVKNKNEKAAKNNYE